jgi:hypothetical protein
MKWKITSILSTLAMVLAFTFAPLSVAFADDDSDDLGVDSFGVMSDSDSEEGSIELTDSDDSDDTDVDSEDDTDSVDSDDPDSEDDDSDGGLDDDDSEDDSDPDSDESDPDAE